jgi:hypothetical protein
MASKTRDAGAWTMVACESVRIAECRGTIFVVRPEAGGQEGSGILCVLMRVPMWVDIDGSCGVVDVDVVVVVVVVVRVIC